MMCFKSDENSLFLAVEALKEGKVVILPTDTVYGFSTIIGENGEKIRKIKGREEGKPFIVLIDSPESVKKLSNQKIPESLLKYWPGPLTIILESTLNDGFPTVAVRCPGDEWLRKVIEQCGSPIYSTSVNRSGSPLLTKENEIIEEFSSLVSLIVRAGDSLSSTPSTIVKIEGDGYKVIRQGAVKL